MSKLKWRYYDENRVDELRQKVQEVYIAPGLAQFTPSFQDIVALLAHIERLEAEKSALASRLDLAEDAADVFKTSCERLNEERQNWIDCAAMMSQKADFYQGLVYRIGELFGEEARTSDDGSIQCDVLALKVPELVERLQAQLAEAKNLFLHERTEGMTDQEQQEEWDDAEEYFNRQMALTAQQADKGE